MSMFLSLLLPFCLKTEKQTNNENISQVVSSTPTLASAVPSPQHPASCLFGLLRHQRAPRARLPFSVQNEGRAQGVRA